MFADIVLLLIMIPSLLVMFFYEYPARCKEPRGIQREKDFLRDKQDRLENKEAGSRIHNLLLRNYGAYNADP